MNGPARRAQFGSGPVACSLAIVVRTGSRAAKSGFSVDDRNQLQRTLLYLSMERASIGEALLFAFDHVDAADEVPCPADERGPRARRGVERSIILILDNPRNGRVQRERRRCST